MKLPVTVFDEIDFSLDLDGYLNAIKIESVPELREEAVAFAKKFGELATPKAVLCESYIDSRGDSSVVIDGIEFTSPVLHTNLQSVERVFPYIATCGAELDGPDLSSYDFMATYWLEVVKEQALSAAIHEVSRYLRKSLRIQKIAAMNPGSADEDVWPIEQQAGLFSLFGDVGPEPDGAVRELIGVRLTESYLMHPNKTVSGIYFVSDNEFINCTVCQRKNCPNRRAPYSGMPQ